MYALPLVLILLQSTPAPLQEISRDSADALRDRARSAERTYEFLLRRLAPSRAVTGTFDASRCDEVVGRFCLYYDGGNPKPLPEPTDIGKLTRARQDAVEALRLAFAARPGDFETAGPLLRYLVEDERVAEAISAARAYFWASRDSVWGPLLEGYALHLAGDAVAAEQRFEEALGHLGKVEAASRRSIAVLLDSRERRWYEQLSDDERAAYEDVVWRLADPLYLLPGNDRRAEHLARHVWSRLLATAPVVTYMWPWGRDLEELTIRYGVPKGRERIFGMYVQGMVEHYDPGQRSFVPPALHHSGYPTAPPPGEDGPLHEVRARSGYAPVTLRKLVDLPHQVSLFPEGDSVLLRIDAYLPFDSVVTVARTGLRGGLFLLDHRYKLTDTVAVNIRQIDDGVVATGWHVVASGRHVYSLEVLEDSSLLAGRARYAVEADLPATGPLLSSVVVSRPFGAATASIGRATEALQPLPELVLSPNDTIGIYGEAHRLTPADGEVSRYRVELAFGPGERSPLLVRAVKWLGRSLGLASPPELPRLSWEGEAEAGHPAVVAVDVPLAPLSKGLYEISLTVTDLVTAEAATSRRLIRIQKD